MKKWAGLFVLFVVPSVICFSFYYFVVRKPIVEKNSATFIKLPYFGPRELAPNGKDTIYHSVPPFSFTNQDGNTFTQEDLRGKIYVADFFFVTCQTICPKMSASLFQVQKKLSHLKDFAILSHTVNPEEDSVPVLKDYSKKVHADPKVWNFVTGNKKEIYDIARYGYYVTALEGDGGPDDFIHSQSFLLVDKEGHIRGIYDGTSPSDVNRMRDEVIVLETEYIFSEKHEE